MTYNNTTRSGQVATVPEKVQGRKGGRSTGAAGERVTLGSAAAKGEAGQIVVVKGRLAIKRKK